MAVSNVELIINAVKAVSALRQVDKEGRKVEQVMTRTQRAMYNLGIVGDRATKKLRSGFKGAAKDLRELNASASVLRGGLARIGGAVAAQQIIETGVSAIESARRIKLLTAASGDTAEALAIAERASVKFGLSQTEANTGVARLLARLKPMGMSLETIEQTFVGFNTAARLAGATASESSGAFLQLTQALGSGVLRGQELNSILEQAPLIAQAIAEELNVTVGALKKLGEEGKILSPVVIRALSRVGREGADQLSEALKGPGQQFRNLSNAAVAFSDTATQKLLPAILPVVKGATELLKGFVALPEPVKAVIVGTTALSLAFAALPPAIVLITGALTALKLAVLAFPFVAAAAGLVAIGVAAAEATKRIGEFNKLTTVNSNSVDELKEQAKKLNEEMDKLEPRTKRNGREARIASKKYDQLADALQRVEDRQKVLSQEFVIAGIRYDANMVPIDPPETVSDQLERLNQPLTDEQKRLLQKTQDQGLAASERLRIATAELGILKEQNETEKIKLQFGLKKANVQAKYSALIKKALSDEERSNLEAAERIELDALRFEKNQAITDELRSQFDALSEVTGQMMELSPFTTELSEEFKSMADTINNEIISGIQGMIEGTKTLGQVASSMLKQIASQMFSTAIMGQKGSGGIGGMILGALGLGGGGGPSGFAPKMAFDFKNAPNLFENPIDTSFLTFAKGGRPPVGRASLVGERGPELFVPSRAGTIVPNDQLGGSTSVVVNVDASGTEVQGNQGNADQLGRLIGQAVQAELIKQKRPGGLLTR